MNIQTNQPNADQKQVPFSAKFGWVVAWLIMLILLFMIGRNFIGSVSYGTSTDQKKITRFYDTGFSDGVSGKEAMALSEKNPLFIKAYNKGFREGHDQYWSNKKPK